MVSEVVKEIANKISIIKFQETDCFLLSFDMSIMSVETCGIILNNLKELLPNTTIVGLPTGIECSIVEDKDMMIKILESNIEDLKK